MNPSTSSIGFNTTLEEIEKFFIPGEEYCRVYKSQYTRNVQKTIFIFSHIEKHACISTRATHKIFFDNPPPGYAKGMFYPFGYDSREEFQIIHLPKKTETVQPTNEKKETKMPLTIIDKVCIKNGENSHNDIDIKDITDDNLLEYIRDEKQNIELLKNTLPKGTESKVVKRKITTYKENIERLISILDARAED